MSLPDYTDLQEQHDKELEDELDKYPVCEWCHEHITDEDLWLINDGIICKECLDYYFKRKTEDYVRE